MNEKEILEAYCRFCEDEIRNATKIATDKKLENLLVVCGGRNGLYHQSINKIYGATMFASQLGVDFDEIDDYYNNFKNILSTSF